MVEDLLFLYQNHYHPTMKAIVHLFYFQFPEDVYTDKTDLLPYLYNIQ